MISYYDGQLTDIMPGNIAKMAEVQALSYALQQGTRLLYDYGRRLYIYANLDGQPEEVIDLLAAELRTQYYRSDMDIDTKRRLVKNTIVWYMNAGTPGAVEELVAKVFGKGEVKEWFQYDGEPYFFKILSNAQMDKDSMEKFSQMIVRVKNTRSHLESLEFDRELQQFLYSCGVCITESQAYIGTEG